MTTIIRVNRRLGNFLHLLLANYTKLYFSNVDFERSLLGRWWGRLNRDKIFWESKEDYLHRSPPSKSRTDVELLMGFATKHCSLGDYKISPSRYMIWALLTIHQEASISLLSLSIRGQTEWKPQSQKERKWKWSPSVMSLQPHGLYVAYQAPPSVEFSRQECWSGFPFPSPGDLPNPGIKPGCPALLADTLPSEPPGKPQSQKTNQADDMDRSLT